jgi:hypothetical protein
LDGTTVENVITGLLFPQGIALDVVSRRIYVVDNDGIMSATLAGTNLTTLVQGAFSIGIALDFPSRKLYFTDITGTGPGKIRRVNLDGTGLEDLVTSGLDTPWGIAIIRIPLRTP